jgi:S-adenosylmethionine:tRNA ribosyltransferase-isomerase
LRTSDFDYDLPVNFIAQTPLQNRDHSRLLVLYRQTGQIKHTIFKDVGEFLKAGDILVVNETRVIPGRLFARKLPGGGRVEILLLHRVDSLIWKAIVGGKGLNKGRQLDIETRQPEERSLLAAIEAVLDGSERLIRFDRPIDAIFSQIGHVPLPPYIHTRLDDPERYQTIYAKTEGSAAAPTAGLHFTAELIDQLKTRGVQFAYVTLHVGLDTFAPVNEDDPEEHKIHTEWCRITQETANQINQAKEAGGRVIAVGTTSVRTLESAAANGKVAPFEGPTSLYILPGYKYKLVDGMITNFHLPRSTLIMLVSAFTSRERILATYEVAKREGYRFYSFGDAMLIV